MYGYIYKITNNINNKVYVGQTTQAIEKRFKQHLKNPVNEHLKAAYKKYGKKNFIC